MEKEILVEVKGLSKKFSRSLMQSLWYGLKEIGSTMLGVKGDKSILRKDEFWAVRDINFQLRRGECLGLIGHNGAGKSTLLKMLNGLIRPDEGSITMRGKVGALIELGAGFNSLLTGRENIYINGQLIGFSKKEIDDKLDSIIEFADIGEFIDSPVQNFSSGMKVRLGFAIASQLEPDILLIDEVMAVGDISFQGKCYNKLFSSINNTCIILVSHSMPQVSRICTKGILLHKGQLKTNSNIQDTIIDYYNIMPKEKGNSFLADNCEFGYIKINGDLSDPNKPINVSYGSEIKIDMKFVANYNTVNVKIHFVNRDLQIVASVKFNQINIVQNEGEINLVGIGPMLFMPGDYKLSISITESSYNIPLIYFSAYWNLIVTGNNFENLPSSILLRGSINGK